MKSKLASRFPSLRNIRRLVNRRRWSTEGLRGREAKMRAIFPAERNLDARFETSVGLFKFGGRIQPGGRVRTRHAVRPGVFLLRRCDHEISILRLDILRARSVILDFVISPSIAASHDRPFREIGRETVRAVELVVPSEIPRTGRGLERLWDENFVTACACTKWLSDKTRSVTRNTARNVTDADSRNFSE